jgi:hypothetical protein
MDSLICVSEVAELASELRKVKTSLHTRQLEIPSRSWNLLSIADFLAHILVVCK